MYWFRSFLNHISSFWDAFLAYKLFIDFSVSLLHPTSHNWVIFKWYNWWYLKLKWYILLFQEKPKESWIFPSHYDLYWKSYSTSVSPSLSLLLNNLVRAIVPPSAALIYLPLRILAWHCSRIRPRPDEVSHETEPKQGPRAKKSHIFSLWVSHVTLRSCPPRGFLYITSHLTGIPLPWIREEFLRPDGRGVSTHVNMWADIKTQRSRFPGLWAQKGPKKDLRCHTNRLKATAACVSWESRTKCCLIIKSFTAIQCWGSCFKSVDCQTTRKSSCK